MTKHSEVAEKRRQKAIEQRQSLIDRYGRRKKQLLKDVRSITSYIKRLEDEKKALEDEAR